MIFALYSFIIRSILIRHFKKKGVKIDYLLSGIPGYLIYQYAYLVDSHLKTPKMDKLVYRLKYAIIIAFIAGIFFALTLKLFIIGGK